MGHVFGRRVSYRWVALVVGLVTCGSGGTPAAHAGAWLQAPGDAYVKVSALHLRADDRWSCDGGREGADAFGGTYRESMAFAYAEIGVHPRATLVVSAAAKDARVVDGAVPDYGTRSTGDLRVGARWGIVDRGVPVSIETVVSLPTYPETDPRAPVGSREQFLPAGTGRAEFEARLQAGASLYPWPVYANLAFGTRERGGAYGDQWLVGLEIGASGERLFAKLDLRGTLARGELCDSASAGAVSLNETVWQAAPEVAVRLTGDVWLSAGVALPFAGRNALRGDQWALGVAWQKRSR